ncbi:hypothetical protein BN1723_013707 [Verticillium longisporum]|uniref:lytic cellulose monooxygenase (C4-dehydrogenating) n=1 Tax=Verticillium longisporum TaxID=100787 RepID=A0A0G4L7H6_VERLO|nr:hypothetical protein HYQ46_012696 [Verticillium longisporum]CRK17972.1 hypothetical protein BN1708_012198 [Verticillium longisporum]CRK25821.1 hypothetical protein BN1723_013707 [Verticillium longisporum]
MKVSSFVLAVVAQVASAHYFFDTNIINGNSQPSFNPTADIRDGSFADGPDIRCNQGAFSAAGRTEVLAVNAGDEVRVRLGVGATMEHPGPRLVYMSRAPGDNVKASDGSGDWFKTFEEGVCSSSSDFTKNA